MKVAVIGWELPPAFSGGLGIHTINLYGAISQVEEVNVYVPDSPNLNQKYPFEVTRVGIGTNGNPYLTGGDFFDMVMEYNKKVVEVFDPKVDLIHAHDWITVPAALQLKRKYHLPVIVTFHSTEYDRSGNFNPQERIMSIENDGYNSADRIITVSGYTDKILRVLYGGSGNTTVIYNGVSSSMFSNVKENYNPSGKVLYFGRVTPQKGPIFFVELARKILEIDEDATFVLAGTGDQIGRVVDMVKMYKIDDKFKFTGFVSDESALKLYRESDVFVLPAVSEPFGMTVLESMSSGTPTVISKTTGVGEALFNSMRCDFWDTDKMSEYVVGILRHQVLREVIGERGRAEALNFSWEKAALKTLGVYHSL